jgi:hypothetical protein
LALASDSGNVTAGANPSYCPSMPPTFGWCRVVELADEFKVSSADILAICDRLGVVVEDASEWLAPDTVDLIRDIVGINGPKAVLSDKPAQTSKAPKAPKPPKAEKAPKAEKPPKPPRAEKAPKPARVAESPELGSVGRDGVRARRVVLIGLVIALLAGASGVFVDRWVGYVTNTDAPATVVTTGER